MKLTDLENLEREATAGPWSYVIGHGITTDRVNICLENEEDGSEISDMEFIAAFRNHAKALLSVVDAAINMRHQWVAANSTSIDMAFDAALSALEAIK